MATSGHGEQGKDAAHHPQSPGEHVQVVVVQQNPAEDDRETIGKLVEGLLGDDNDDEGKKRNISGRKLTVALSRHSLLIVIALLILAGGQVASVLLRLYEDKREDRTTRGDEPTTTLLSAAIQSVLAQSLADARQADAEAQQAANAAQQAANEAQQNAQAKSPPSQPPGDTKFVFLPSPPNGVVSPPYSPPSATGEHNTPILADVEVTPCFRSPSPRCPAQTEKEPTFPGPISLTVKYENKERVGLVLLDRQAYLTTSSHDTGTQGIAGICAYPKVGYGVLWPTGDPIRHDFDLYLGPFLSKDDKRRGWNTDLYLTLCSTYRFSDSAPILDRRVYKITHNDKSGQTLVSEENSENLVLQ
ncbi:MAG: hypothetical protein WCF74_11675 [Candidatus Sulfotelmatobacter sp.]